MAGPRRSFPVMSTDREHVLQDGAAALHRTATLVAGSIARDLGLNRASAASAVSRITALAEMTSRPALTDAVLAEHSDTATLNMLHGLARGARKRGDAVSAQELEALRDLLAALGKPSAAP
jgi:hypothetical protein